MAIDDARVKRGAELSTDYNMLDQVVGDDRSAASKSTVSQSEGALGTSGRGPGPQDL